LSKYIWSIKMQSYLCVTKRENMKSTEIKVGQKFETFYGNGTPSGISTVVKVTDKSLFVTSWEGATPHREALTTVQKYLNANLWIPVK
jgi:hypothetical protein